MSWAQPIIEEAREPSSLRALFVRYTSLDIEEWERTRSRGRKRFVRFMTAIGWGAPVVMLLVEVARIVHRDLSWRELLAPAFLGWFLPLVIAAPALMHVLAPLEWSLIEEKYRDALGERGQRPAPIPD